MTFSLINTKTAEDIAADVLAAAKEAARAECRRRIVAVCDETAQINLAAAAASGLLTPEQMGVYQAGLVWVSEMRSAWEQLAIDGQNVADDASWPNIPAGVSELAAAF